jgi:DEAD/DEAH box helicase domain-containing protein
MLPEILAQKIKEQVYAYLESTFEFNDPELRLAFLDFLSDPETGITKGPWLDIRFPYRKAKESATGFFQFGEVQEPYIHQWDAWNRLKKNKHTIVTTGTGSGKTECFLYPILDHVLAERKAGKKGIKAIVLYPMNALATDQEKRFARMIKSTPSLNEAGITVGTYIGRAGSRKGRKKVTEEGGITDHDTLKDSPPDILLTNYKMLDFLLMRPTDAELWKDNGPDTLKFLVLDEIHTYDGAQGTDVACLIRRLKARVDVKPGNICFVGTSATLDTPTPVVNLSGSTGDAEEAADTPQKRLAQFASDLSGEDIDAGAVLLEDRLSASEMLNSNQAASVAIPSLSDLQPLDGENRDTYCQRQAELWKAPTEPIELGHWLEDTDLYRLILTRFDEEKKLGKTPWEWKDIVKDLNASFANFRRLSPDETEVCLFSFLSLFHYAKRKVGSIHVAFLPLQVQIWIREMRRIGRTVEDRGSRFIWLDDAPKDYVSLPAYHCRDCGNSGWVGLIEPGSDAEITAKYQSAGFRLTPTENTKEIYRGFFEGGDKYRSPYIIMFRSLRKGEEWDPSRPLYQFSPDQRIAYRYHEANTLHKIRNSFPIIWDQTKGESDDGREIGKQVCPDCGSFHGLLFIGTQSSTLASIGIDELFGNPLNENAKLLAFTDSVQDASHRAGFFSARAYLFTLRTIIMKTLREAGGNLALQKMPERIIRTILDANPKKGEKNAIATILPPDWEGSSDWLNYRQGNVDKIPKELNDKLFSALSWTILQDYGSSYFQGRSLDWAGSSVLFWAPNFIDPLVNEIWVRKETVSPLLNSLTKEQIRLWLFGILQRAKNYGAIEHLYMREFAANPFWKRKATRLPQFLSRFTHKQLDTIPIFSEVFGQTWFDRWMERSLVLSRFPDLGENEKSKLKSLFVEFASECNILIPVKESNTQELYLIGSRSLEIYTDVAYFKCSTTGKPLLVPKSMENIWKDAPSLEFFGKLGVYKEGTFTDRQQYYKKRYNSNAIRRVVAQEHTGLLETDDREKIEEGFLHGELADEPNVLACTSTLEMGIDIGDLSATLLCSVPPTTSNYLQRIGRAGRSTGSALILAIVNQKPHDLFFYARPRDLLKGKIHAPGCWLDAPSVLFRQFIGFSMDRATKDRIWSKIPGILKDWLVEAESPESEYGRFLIWFQENYNLLFSDFLSLFSELKDDTKVRLEIDCAPLVIVKLFETIKKDAINRRKVLSNNIETARKNLKRDDISEEQKKEWVFEEKYLTSRLGQFLRLGTLELWTNDGALPNYAFPEKGVMFEGSILERNVSPEGGSDMPPAKAYTVFRPASTAIRELAPWNRFYIGKKQFDIERIQIRRGDDDLIEEKRICGNCGFLFEDELNGIAIPDKCPQCEYLASQKDSLAELGQKQRFLPFNKSGAISVIDSLRGMSGDQDEERKIGFYSTIRLFDSTRRTPLNPLGDNESGFGIEFYEKMKLRDVNGGYLEEQHSDSSGVRFHASKVLPHGFEVCTDCGGVLKKLEREEDRIKRHSPFCKYRQTIEKASQRKKVSTTESGFESTYLYRELESEAIRMIIPGINEDNVKTLEACIRLGLKIKFSGTPAHILIAVQEVPEPARLFTRYFLVLMDAVPGGTGFLKALYNEVSDSGQLAEGLVDVFKRAEMVLTDCECGKEDERTGVSTDGCYRCIRSYQQQFDYNSISRLRGIELMKTLIEAASKRTPIGSIKDIGIEKLIESELEKSFVQNLKEWVIAHHGTWKDISRYGNEIAQFSVPSKYHITWTLNAQEALTLATGVTVPSTPDFMIKAKGTTLTIPEVAIFIDGFLYHRWQYNRFEDDLKKRKAILETGRYLVFSFPGEIRSTGDISEMPFLDEETLKQVKGIFNLKVRESPSFQRFLSSPLDALASFLLEPDKKIAEKLMGFVVMSVQNSYKDKSPAIEVKDEDGYFQWMFPYHDTPVHHLILDDRKALEDIDTNRDELKAKIRISWKAFWKYANLFQFLPKVEWTSLKKQELTDEGFLAKESDGFKNDSYPEDGSDWFYIYSNVIGQLKPTVLTLFRMGLSPADLEYTPEDSTLRDLVAELAWPKQKVAILWGDHSDHSSIWEENGWKIKTMHEVQKMGRDQLVEYLKQELKIL